MKAGDVVELNSGGPNMTVQNVNTDGSVFVRWFDDNDHLQAAVMTKDILRVIEVIDDQ